MVFSVGSEQFMLGKEQNSRENASNEGGKKALRKKI